ncbi:hypothetical protein LTR70_004536 [Exophiala xenobiotica]|uniref:Uncharacterized protein n=1 Tax=Lithohypha guttulata TaxID=1690604 RepID=A0ABR0KNV9_9EURO|nr:hypothetical protein LTR24_000466 [Lithohypha guttulata]KAK5320453.1 hypothetical protein LTR70_004536 [Exophiala xenobiotica]
MALERLERSAPELGLSKQKCEKVVRTMARQNYRPHKENFGSDMSDRQSTKRIDIPGVSDSVSIPHVGIRSGGLMFTNDDIRSIFDSQLNSMFKLIDRQMDKMGQLAPNSGIVGLETQVLLFRTKLTDTELYGALWRFRKL